MLNLNTSMNCIVTAGPTYEPLDGVRRLTNFSTGRLGTELANFLAARGHKVTLLIGEHVHVSRRTARGASGDFLHHGGRFARKAESGVSQARGRDFSRGGGRAILRLEKFSRPTNPANSLNSRRAIKFPRGQSKLLVELVATPKIIAGLCGWFPQTRLFGWKFEADGARADAISAAKRQIAECSNRFVHCERPGLRRRFLGGGAGWPGCALYQCAVVV